MFQPNSVIAGRYQVIRLVGQGGMSNLYLAHDRKYNNAIVVVKEMTAAYSDPKEQQMAVDLFHREAKLLASLNHRHIPKVYDYFQFAGKYYLSMEFIDGEDLAQKLEATKGPLPEAQVLEWAEQIATVLFYLHKHEPPIVFRDVKPSNIMLCQQGVKLIDFGIARHFDQAKKGDTMRIGSPGYAPPEQYAAQTDPRSDIYALGVTLHHALTGRDPTTTSTPFLVPPARKLNPALSEGTAAMLARATQLDPADRYQSVLEMKNDIKQILQRGHQSTRVVGAPPPPPTAVGSPADASAAAALAASSTSASAAPTSTAAATAATSGTVAGTTPSTNAPATSGSGSLASVAPANAAATPVIKPRRRTWRGKLLLVATVLLAGGGLYIAGPEGRAGLLTQGKSWFNAIPWSGTERSAPEDTIRDVLMSGDPRELLPLFGNGVLDSLSQDKQALYRLNLLAAEVSGSSPGIVHLLYPKELVDSDQEADIFRGAARAVAAINATGGLDKQLLIVIPRTFSPGRIDNTIAKLSAEPSPGGQRILIVSPASETLQLSAESLAQPLFLLDSDNPQPSPDGNPPHLSAYSNGKLNLAEIYSLNQIEDLGRLLWAAPGEAPSEKAEKVELSNTSESVSRLLQRSESEGAQLVLTAEQASALENLEQAGKVLILAADPSQLPKISSSLKAEAVVLGSPLRASGGPSANGTLFLSPNGSLDLAEARIFDAVILASLSAQKSYSGITITRQSPGKMELPGRSVNYRWSGDGWVPILSQRPSRGNQP